MANLIVKCPTCDKIARVKKEFTAINKRYTLYECGHAIAIDLSISPTAEIDIITSRLGHNPFPFQSETVRFLERAGLSGVVNHEMGLGKTIIECLLLRRNLDKLCPALIVTKSGLKHQWFQEIVNWAGQIPQILTVAKPSPAFDYHNIFIVSADTLYRLPWMQVKEFDKATGTIINLDNEEKLAIRKSFKHICIDEVQAIKNPAAKRTQGVKLVSGGKSVVTLSGTPIKNRAEEYFSCLNLVRPDMFPTEQGFQRQHIRFNRMTGRSQGLANPERFHDLTKDFIIRFNREEVLPDLPKIFRQFHSAEIEEKDSREAYEKELEDFLEYMDKIGGEASAKDTTNILGYFSRMRHITGLAKIEPTVNYVENFLLSNNRKITIFLHHKDVAEFLKMQLDKLLADGGYAPTLQISSELDSKQRLDVIEQFKKPEHRILIASTLAAGEGLNLQFCSDCLIIERQWNPANEEQAEARFPRPGSTATQVNAAYLIAAGTIDEMFTEIVERKRAVLAQVLDGKESNWQENSLIKELTDALTKSGKAKWRATL